MRLSSYGMVCLPATRNLAKKTDASVLALTDLDICLDDEKGASDGKLFARHHTRSLASMEYHLARDGTIKGNTAFA